MKSLALSALAILGIVAGCQPALAHAHLKASQPAAGAKVPSPAAIALTFSERVIPRFSGIALADPAGHAVALGKAAAGEATSNLSVPVPATLPSGTYTVTWHAVSVDTHRTQGSFRFTVE